MDTKSLHTLSEAIGRQYRVRALYAATVDRFGPEKPFAYLAESSERDVETLRRIYANLGVEPPPDRWLGRLKLSADLAQICRGAIDSESETYCRCERDLFDTTDPTLRWALSRLAERCRYQRLPLLQRALERHERERGGRP